MRAMYKSELAAYAGVSTGTLRRWLMPYRQELNEIGVKPKDQLLSPKAVKFICDQLCKRPKIGAPSIYCLKNRQFT